MAHPTSTNGSATIQKDVPAETTKASVQTSASSTSTQTPQASSHEDLYDYQKCTVMIVIQLRPQREAGGPRPVLLSVQNGTANKEDLPMFRLLPSEEDLGSPLPPALVALLEALQQDLPARKQRHEQRAVKPTATQTNTAKTPKDTRRKIQPAPSAKTTSAPPPVPTATNPVPKDGLVFGGIFDNL